MKKQFLFLLLVAIYMISAGSSFAARNISISSHNSYLVNDEELTVVASSSGFTAGEKIYIKGAFFKDGSSNYFGLTKYNEFWIRNSTNALSQREIFIDSWDNSVVVKPDFSDSGFSGAGDYKFKLGYYYFSGSGNLSSVNWSSNELEVNIGSTPTSAPTQIKEKTKSNSSNSLVKSSTPTKSLSAPTDSSPAINARIDKNAIVFAKISHIERSASEYAQIKPITNESIKKEAKVLGISDTKTYAPLIFISGLMFLLAGVSSFVIKILKERNII